MKSYSISPNWLNRTLNVVLLGCGGTGSEMVDELYRMHSLLISLGGQGLNVIAYDSDTVTEANIGRQRFWPCDIGYHKAEVLITRLNSFACTDWSYQNEDFNCKQLNHHFVEDVDILITCVDSATLRAKIGKKALKLQENDTELLWLDCGNDTHLGNVIMGHICTDRPEMRLPNVFSLYPILSEMKDNATPSCSTQEALFKQDYGINRSVAREAANLMWQLIRHSEIEYHGSYIDIQQGSVTSLDIDPMVWESFGYSIAA